MTGTRSTLWEPGRTCASAGGKPRAPRFSPSTPKRTPPEGGSPISTGFGSGPPSIELRLEVEVEGLAIRIIRCGPGIAVPGRAADDRRAPAEDVVDSSRELEVVTDVPRQSEVEVARGRQLRVGQRVQRRHGRRVGPQRQQVFVDRDRVDESPAHRHIDGAVDPADARDPLDPGYGLAAGRAIGAGALLPVVRQLLDRDDRVLALHVQSVDTWSELSWWKRPQERPWPQAPSRSTPSTFNAPALASPTLTLTICPVFGSR